MMKHLRPFILAAVTGLIFLSSSATALACTGIYVGSELTEDGSTLFGRTEDEDMNQKKQFITVPAQKHPKGAQFVDASNGFTYDLPEATWQYFAIPDQDQTKGHFYEAGYNEQGVAITATTSAKANQEVLTVDPYVEHGLSESSITQLVLGQATSARHGIELLAHVIETTGASESGGLIIADQAETWYMEILSGHQYAAKRLPKDQLAVFSNAFFLQDMSQGEDGTIQSKGLFEVAKKAGRLAQDATRLNIQAAYGKPLTDDSKSRYIRALELLDPTIEVSEASSSYPLLHSTDRKFTLKDIMKLQRDRYEGTDQKLLDDSTLSPTEMKDALWPIGNITTMEAHIFQLHSDMPKTRPGLMWLAMGSPTVSPYVPYFAGTTEVLSEYTGDYYDRALKLFNAFLDEEATRKGPIQDKVQALEDQFIQEIEQERQSFIKKYNQQPEEATADANTQASAKAKQAYELLDELIQSYH